MRRPSAVIRLLRALVERYAADPTRCRPTGAGRDVEPGSPEAVAGRRHAT